MKRATFASVIILLLVCASISNAQTLVGIRGGFNYSKINGIGSIGNYYSWKNGYNVGVFMSHNIGEKLFFQPELVFSTRGYNYLKIYPDNRVLSGDTTQLSQNTRINYIDIPLLARLQFKRVFMEAGPQFGYLLSSKSYNEHILNKNGDLTYLISSVNSRNAMEPIDIGFILGVGYQTKHGIGLGFRFNQGFREVVKRVNWQKNVVLQLSASYTWGFKAYALAEKTKSKEVKDEYFISKNKNKSQERSYRITSSRNVPRINIVKIGEAVRSEVQIVFNSVGTQNPKDVLISGSSGTEEQTALFIGYRDCEVPFKGTLTYTVAAALGSSAIESYLEFEINEPGVWRVQIQTY